MSVESLTINDVILFKTNRKYIGVIKYIGLIYPSDSMTQYVGVELLESIGELGHCGTINNYSYFTTKDGYGTHCKLTNVIRKLKTCEIFALFQQYLKQKNKQIDDLQLIIHNNKTKKSLPSTPTNSNNYTADYSPQKTLSLSTITKNHSGTQSIVSLFSRKPEYGLFPDTQPVKEENRKKIPVKEYKRKKHRKKKKIKKKKKCKRRRNSDDSNKHESDKTPTFKDYSHSAPNPDYNNDKQVHLNPIKMDEWLANNNMNIASMESYKRFLAGPIAH